MLYPIRKFIKMWSIFVLSSILLGCTYESKPSVTSSIPKDAKDGYMITTIDGNCYLNFSDGNQLSQPNDELQLESLSLRFASLSAMRDAFVNQGLTEREIALIKNNFPRNANGILICNVNELYQPTLPSNMSMYYDIELIGQTYVFTIGDSSVDPSVEEALGTITGSFLYANQETYEMHFADEFTEYFKNVTIQSQTITTDRNATVYDYAIKRGEFRIIQYDIIDGEKTLHVSEHYSLAYTENAYGEDLTISGTVPNRINIFGYQDGEYFEVSLSFLTERPTIEWLSSFGLEEYVEQDTVVKK